MEKYLINDSRLTQTMSRVRSGKANIFTEKDGVEIRLIPDRKELYAELIEGQWYWINGCDKCNGTIENYCYIRCEEHDRCISCGKKRSQIKEVPWGHPEGFICKPCAERERLNQLESAINKLNGEEPDTHYQSKIICPHCGTKLSNDDVSNDEILECHLCLNKLHVEIDYSPYYTTSKI